MVSLGHSDLAIVKPISNTLAGSKIVDHSNVVGTAPTTSSFSA